MHRDRDIVDLLLRKDFLSFVRRGSIVLDPFMGSGTTIIAGQTVGRRVYGMELDPRYVDVAVRRWERFTGRDAILESTGQTFGEVEAARNETGASKRSLREEDSSGRPLMRKPPFSTISAQLRGGKRSPAQGDTTGSRVRAAIRKVGRRASKMPPPWRKQRWVAKSSRPSTARNER